MRGRAVIIALALATTASAQPRWQVALPSVQQDGYYSVLLSPELVGRSRADLADLRVLDSLGHEVAYVLKHEPALYEQAWSKPYKLLRNERVDQRTIIEIEADSAATVDELQLHIRNADVTKRARISGSDDRKEWFIIKEECLSVGEGEGGASVLRFVDLPLSDYHFYRLELNDKKSLPVQVLALGHSGRVRREGRYTPIEGLRFLRKEEGTTTRMALFGNAPFQAARLVFDIVSEVPFQRNGAFATWTSVMVHERRRQVERRVEGSLGAFVLSSDARGMVPGPGSITDTLWIAIENQNDRPLVINGIEAFQLEQRLIARLKAGERYRIVTGDDRATAPRYDLTAFQDSIPISGSLQLPGLSPVPDAKQHSPPAFAPEKKWIWVALIGLGVVIAVSAVRLLRKSEEGPPA